MTTNEQQGTLMTRKPRGRKLSFLIGGPTLSFAQRCGVPSKEWVYVWIGETEESRCEWSCISKCDHKPGELSN